MSKSADEKSNAKEILLKHSKQHRPTGLEIAQKQLWVAYIQTGVTIAGVIVGILALVAAYKSLSNKVSKIESEVLTGQFIITSPDNGANVGPTDMISGKTPYPPEMHHYIVITPLEVGEDFVQDKPVTIYSGGLWTGTARFGTGDVGIGEKFTVRCLATKSELKPGTGNIIPPDARFSVPITVTRTQ